MNDSFLKTVDKLNIEGYHIDQNIDASLDEINSATAKFSVHLSIMKRKRKKANI